MKRETVRGYGKTVLLTLVCLMLMGCASGAETGEGKADKSENTPLFCRRQQEYQESDDHEVYIDYPQLSGMADQEKEKRLNALIKKDALKILELDICDGEYCFSAGLDYEIKYLDDQTISILYKGYYGYITPGSGLPAVAMATTIDMEEEKVKGFSG